MIKVECCLYISWSIDDEEEINMCMLELNLSGKYNLIK